MTNKNYHKNKVQNSSYNKLLIFYYGKKYEFMARNERF